MCMTIPTGTPELPYPQHMIDFNRHWMGKRVPGVEAQMRLAIALASKNVETGAGGPFGSVLVSTATDEVICGGVNLVVRHTRSTAHGEMVASELGQRLLDVVSFDGLGVRLVTSAAMCIGCWGSSFGMQFAEIVSGATGDDVERLTPFREGPLPDNWEGLLRAHGIVHTGEVLREEACEPLAAYGKDGVNYFNAGSRQGS